MSADDYAWLFDFNAFRETLTQGKNPLPLYKNALKTSRDTLRCEFEAGRPIEQLIWGRAWLVDGLLQLAWPSFISAQDQANTALIAVGGYGRGELHPASDIDFMILFQEENPALLEAAGHFVTFLWDIGLEVGHSVRSLAECVDIANQDITVVTNLTESRLIAGSEKIFRHLRIIIDPKYIWPSRRFFEAKWQEQIERHQRFHDTAYNLEPNIKEGPGGLRDIQMIGWVTKRHFDAQNLHDLVVHQFLTEDEYQRLIQAQNFLWRVRFALHMLAGRKEERLLFDYQPQLAKLLHFEDETAQSDHQTSDIWNRAADGHRLGVELFMKKYYRTIMELRSLNEILLQLYQEVLLHKDDSEIPQSLNRRFQVHKGFIEVVNDQVFQRYPFALFEIFLLMQQHPEIIGIRAATSRLLRSCALRINTNFRQDIRCRTLFIEILKQEFGITSALRNLARYNILDNYIPAFANILGLMQYDLYHVYTVDQHTLFVLRNLRRFFKQKCAHEFPLASKVASSIPKPELLYLAGLFHDIAKGRGGDHSTLGAADAQQFCQDHGLSKYDAELVAWLVQNHLLMSAVAQHRDISDPAIVNDFANCVGDFSRLDYLYLLTVADMRGTNPKLWNSWKDSLLIELYQQTRRALARGLENPIDRDDRIRESQSAARKQLQQQHINTDAIERLWQTVNSDYFLRYNVDEIVWHATLLQHDETQNHPLIATRTMGDNGVSQVFIYAPCSTDLFARVTITLHQLRLSTLEARIVTSNRGYSLDSYSVLDESGEPINDPQRLADLEKSLETNLRADHLPLRPRRVTNRQIKNFPVPTEVSFTSDPANNRTIMEVISNDRPGLLASIAQVLARLNIQLQNAKISTFGAQAEDVFFITNDELKALDDEKLLQQLKQAIIDVLDNHQKEN
ncbi:MAG: [protein-PII] uridylyltransferase [Gammaproteobacteria bacterium]|nr:[protein-PII] uridylyltransferase [Gammaproteobacteria bacterium]